MDVDTLLAAYRVDRAHARQVADHSLALFDAAAERHGLPAEARRLVEIGGLLHNVGLTTDPPAHHLVGRDIVLRHAIDGLGRREQALLACMVAFHRKKARPQLEPAYLSLGKRGQALALRLSAILRVGDGLDYAQSQTTRLLAVEPGEGRLLLRLAGPHAASDGARAVEKADLWAKLFEERLEYLAEGAPDGPASAPEAGAAEEEEAPELAPWYAAPDVPLAELGRVLLRRYFRRLRSVERDVRADEEIEAVHNLRVTTRRLRAALRLLEPVAPRDALRPYARAIGRLARTAGAARDLDVLLADMASRAAALPEALRPGLAELAEALRAARAARQHDLIGLLDDDDHDEFARGFATLMCRRDGWDDGPRVRDLAGSTIWRHYEELRSHDCGGLPADPDELHEMRIAGKRLRYVIELFEDSFGERAALAVDPLVAFQDHLGALQDVAVAGETLRAHAHSEAAGAALEAYLGLRAAAAEALRGELAARWEKLASATYRRNLMGLIVKL